MKVFCTNLFILLFSVCGIAQKHSQVDTLKTRPTVALVLSGGGAKGFAEIGTLEIIDELGIPIDYIVGTSMGASMGGFYAIGFSGKEIAKQVAQQDWSNVFTDKIISTKTPISRKEELSRYAFSFPIKKGISLPKGLVRGQEVMNILSKYTAGYHGFTDFNKFPIPYSCMVTDLETGEDVILDAGNLPQAIRASMSIPSVFSPVEIGGRTFIDGGVVNNFPTNVAKAKGYDYIIGVDVQSPLLSQKELQSGTAVAQQLLAFLGKKQNDENVKLADVYIHPNISKYTPSSFSPSEVDSLIEIGRIEARKAYPKLVKLKEKLGKNIRLPKRHTPNFNAPLFFNSVTVEGLKKIKKDLFYRKFKLKGKNSITTKELKEKIDDVSAVLDLDLLTYQLVKDSLKFTAHERTNNRLNVGLHYDSDTNSSILLNTTWNHLLFKHSRASIDAVLGKNLQFTLRYTLKFGDIPHLNFKFDTKKYSLRYHEKNYKIAEDDLSYFKFEVNTQFIAWDNYSVGGGFRSEYVKSDNAIYKKNATRKLHKWYANYFGFIHLNTLDNMYYPRKGNYFEGELKYTTDGISEQGIIAYFNYKKALQFSQKLGICLNFQGRSLLDNNLNAVYKNHWGGISSSTYLDKQLPFVGAKWIQGTNETMAIGRIDMRYELFRKNYLILTANYGRYCDKIEDFLMDSSQDIIGAGLTYSYDSFIGPVELTIMHSNAVKKPLVHISIGYNF